MPEWPNDLNWQHINDLRTTHILRMKEIEKVKKFWPHSTYIDKLSLFVTFTYVRGHKQSQIQATQKKRTNSKRFVYKLNLQWHEKVLAPVPDFRLFWMSVTLQCLKTLNQFIYLPKTTGVNKLYINKGEKKKKNSNRHGPTGKKWLPTKPTNWLIHPK